MFNGINMGNLLKGINLKKFDVVEIASKLTNIIPNGQGKKYIDIAMNVAKNGGNVKGVKNALENMLPPDQKSKLMGMDLWKNIPEDKDAVLPYGKNVAKQFNILKNDDNE